MKTQHDSQLSQSAEETGFLLHLPGQPEAINADSFDDDVLRSTLPVIVEFWAARCGACRRLAPEIAALPLLLGTPMRLFTLNVDEELDAALRFDVLSIPTTLLFVGGVETARHIGPADRASLVKLLGPYVTVPTTFDVREDEMPKITWDDSEDIGIELAEKYPDTDPLTVRFTDLHRLVTELKDFADDPASSNEAKLETIQMAWLEEYKDTHE